MKDPIFVAWSVAEAVRVASRTLCVPQDALRYVVLEAGQPGGRGLSPTEARIAVLIEKPGQPAHLTAGAAPEAPDETGEDSGLRPRRRGVSREVGPAMTGHADPATGLRELLRHFARVSERELAVDVVELRDIFEVQINGAGANAFFDARGETLAALEHVLDRIYGRALLPRRVRVSCAGYREYRDELLSEGAHDLARQVRNDGLARTTAPLNSYERRIIHVALEQAEGVVTFSVGEGHGRRVTVALAGTTATSAPDTPVGAAPVDPVAEAVTAGPPPTVVAAAEHFDVRQYNRPPEGDGTPELM